MGVELELRPTMRTLSLLRHATAAPAAAGEEDRERPLDGAGLREARRIGAHLERRHVEVALVLCSPARRTRETLEQVLPHLAERPEVRYEEDLYLGSSETLMESVELVDEFRAVLLIAHNPGLADLAFQLAGDGDSAAAARLKRGLPPGALAVFRLPVERWQDARTASGRLVEFAAPGDPGLAG